MCDDDAFDDMVAYRLRLALHSRRGFASWSIGAASLLAAGCRPTEPVATPRTTHPPAPPPTEDAGASLEEAEVRISTPDGTCDAHFVHPKTGAAPGVLVWPDIFGLRPAFREMGRRLARSGYAILTVNPFYRTQPAPTSSPNARFDDPKTREALMALSRSLTPGTQLTDAKALTAWLDQQPAVDRSKKLGTTGYCMGGPIVFRTAAASPERVGAAATFHGGGLVTDKPESPHLLVPKMKAQLLVAVASNDDAKQPAAKDTLKAAFAEASLTAKVEVYEGALHGWCPPDSHVYARESAERAWTELLALFARALV